MNILFITHNSHLFRSIYDYSELMAKQLKALKHNVKIVTDTSMAARETKNEDSFTNSQSWSRLWDVLVIQNSDTFFKYHKFIKRFGDTPKIFISHSSYDMNKSIPYDGVSKIIKVAEKISVNEWGFPQEFIENIPSPIIPHFIKYKYSKKKISNLLAFYDLEENGIDVMRMLIMGANTLPNIKLNIVYNEGYNVLNKIANPNINFIKFSKRTNETSLFAKSDLILGSGRTAIKSLSLGKPVIVVGRRGFGGLVTPENYIEFKKRNFEGRFGGEENEIIPIDLLSDHIVDTLNKGKELFPIISSNYKAVCTDYNIQIVADRLVSVICEIKSKNYGLKKMSEFKKLKPLFLPEFTFVENKEDSFYIMNKINFKIFFNIQCSLKEILEKLDGNTSIEDIFKENGYGHIDMRVFKKIFHRLFINKIVTF